MSYLIDISKTQIKITDIIIEEIKFFDDAIKIADFKSIEWQFDINVHLTKAFVTEDKKFDRLEVTIVINHFTKNKE